MTKQSTGSVANEVRQLARAHKVTAERDSVSLMASRITALSGDSVVLDTIEQLLVNLKRKGVVSTSDLLAMQVRYLKEKDCCKGKAKKDLQA